MNQGFGQFCPVSLASEVLTQRWMLLIVHELLKGNARFSDIRRGIPRISATLLKQRLDTLEGADVVQKKRIGATDNFEYFLTESGLELEALIKTIGTWGQRWARDIRNDDLDAGFLVWNMRLRFDHSKLPPGRTVMHWEFLDAPRRERFFWLVAENGSVDVCLKPPGFPADIKITTTVRTMAEVWGGSTPIRKAIRNRDIALEGTTPLKKSFPDWLLMSPFASIKKVRK